MTRRITECGLLRNRTEMRLRAGEQPAPDLQCAEAHKYKNFLATPAHNLEMVGLRLTKQKSGERANDGRVTCAGLQGRAERVAEQWRRKPKPRKAGYGMRLRPDFYKKGD